MLVFKRHALQRMLERRIALEDVKQVLASGDAIESYHDDQPFPSRLMLGWHDRRPIHVVAADDDRGDTLVITVYEPSMDEWEPGFRSRKK